MREYPYPRNSEPYGLSPRRFLLWLAQLQLPTLLGGLFFGIIWMLAQAFAPFVIGRAIDEGVVAGDFDRLFYWTALLAALILVQAITAGIRHRLAMSNWLQAALTSKEVIGTKVALGSESVGRAMPTGEIVTAASSDAPRIGQLYDITARLAGSIVSYVVVALLVMQIHFWLGIAVFVGVPGLGALLGLVIRPFQKRQMAQREAMGEMSSIGADTVAGLRVLRGIGGEHIFVDRYRERSQRARIMGIDVARSVALLDATQLLIVGVFGVFFTLAGAALALNGEITVGELLSLYGFSVFLVSPIRVGTEALNAGIRGVVGARKVSRLLGAPALVNDNGTQVPPVAQVLRDEDTGVELTPGGITALVCAEPGRSAAVAKRLGRYVDAESTRASWGGVPVTQIPLAQLRSRIVYSQAEAQLFTGPLREGLDPHGRHSDARITEALLSAAGLDILEAIDDGLDYEVDERGRSFSGGQRQRLSLARALLTEAEVLLLVEPTSAVDAHTEALIAQGLLAARGTGSVPEHAHARTTLVTTASPLMLHVMDKVVFLPEQGAPVTGTHHELINSNDDYRKVVIRSE